MIRDMNRQKPRRRGRQDARPHLPDVPSGPQAQGSWKQSRDRYLALAEAAASSGDKVKAENYYQHAEHYLRLMRQGA